MGNYPNNKQQLKQPRSKNLIQMPKTTKNSPSDVCTMLPKHELCKSHQCIVTSHASWILACVRWGASQNYSREQIASRKERWSLKYITFKAFSTLKALCADRNGHLVLVMYSGPSASIDLELSDSIIWVLNLQVWAPEHNQGLEGDLRAREAARVFLNLQDTLNSYSGKPEITFLCPCKTIWK